MGIHGHASCAAKGRQRQLLLLHTFTGQQSAYKVWVWIGSRERQQLAKVAAAAVEGQCRQAVDLQRRHGRCLLPDRTD
jgi:hypothetical protein